MCSLWPFRSIFWTQKLYCAGVLFVCLSVSLLKRKEEIVGKAITLNYTLRPNLNSSRLFLREIRSFLVATNKLPAWKGWGAQQQCWHRVPTTTTTEGTRMKKTAGKVSCFKRESKVRAFCFQTISWQTNFRWQLICSYLSSQFGWLTDVITAFPFKCSQFQQIAPKSLFHFSPKSKRKENGVISISVEKKERRKLKVPHQNDYM